MDDTENNTDQPDQISADQLTVEDDKINDLLEKRKTHKQTLEELKRSGREQRAQEREEKKKVHRSGTADEEEYFVQQLSALSISVHKPERYNGTGLIYDEFMLKHKNEWDPNFPEKPERISEPFKRCSQLGLVERCIRIEKSYATEDMVLLQHTQELLENVKATVAMNIEQRKAFSQQYDSVYFNDATYEAAVISLGSVIDLMEQILKKKVTNGLALVRPPGHHAMNNELCGFCYFNNVAIAAKHALDNLGVKKILIVDWDVHHGQATQYMFYDDPRVLYFSIHRYQHGSFWPNLRESDYDFIGKEKGLGYNINVPLNKTRMTDSDYLAIFHQVLLPVAYEFCPDLILVSAGYDCAIGCPEGEMRVSPAMFGHMTHNLMSLADGRVCVCLEGGYCLKSLSESVALTLKALLGDPCPLLPPQMEPSDSIAESILNVIKVLRPHWSCFSYQDLLEEDELCPFEEVNTLPPKPGIKFITEDNKPKVYPLTYTFPEEVKEFYLSQKMLDPVIDQLIAETQLMRPPYRTCIVYDEDMRAHRAFDSHPEDPERITRIFDKHVEWGLIDSCLRVKSRHATEAEVQLIHSSKYVEELKELREKNSLELRQCAWRYNSIYLCEETYNTALLATGSLLSVVHTVLTGQATNGVAVVRPPGHHAECTKCMGFCFFNNVAIAAKYAQEQFGLKRILILDWDVHHGNGTQHQFYEDSSVLVINLHRYDGGFFYPSSPDGSVEMAGKGDGEGYNVNIAWSYGYMGDAEYIAAFQQIVMPIAYQFAPELVLVSAGFDSALGDPLGSYLVSPLGYAHMTHMLSALANGRVILTLEGGYNLTSISNSMCMCTSVLLGDPCPDLKLPTPKESAIKTIKDVIDVHKNYWKCLKFRVKIPDLSPPKEEETLKSPGTVHAEQACHKVEKSPEGSLAVRTDEDNSDLAAAAVAPSVQSLNVFSDKVVIPLDDYHEVNFLQLIRSNQKSIETETETKIFLRGQALENTGLDQTEKILFVYVYSENKEKVENAVLKINEIKDREIAKLNRNATTVVTNKKTTSARDSSNQSCMDTISSRIESLKVDQSAEVLEIKDSVGNAEGAVGGREERPNNYRELLTQMEGKGVEQMFAVTPLNWCPHLETVTPLPADKTVLDTNAPCEKCGDASENWICLVCYRVFCSRFVKEHMVMHGLEDGHVMCLSNSDLSVWCYGCDQYVDNQVLQAAKNAAHIHKFGHPLS